MLLHELGAVFVDSAAELRDSATSPYQVPGCTCDSTEVTMPLLSMSSSDICGDHFGAPILCLLSASRCTGGRKW